jgi:ribose 5-phosphate isomerase B
MRVHIGSDHAGYELKAALIERLGSLGHDVVDHGPEVYDAEDDYPPFVMAAAAGTVADPGSLGIVIGGSGNGEAIAANKVPGVRCALVWSDETAELGRLHNDANVVSLGARQYPIDDAVRFATIFLSTAFTEESRHKRRIAMLTAYEGDHVLPHPQ